MVTRNGMQVPILDVRNEVNAWYTATDWEKWFKNKTRQPMGPGAAALAEALTGKNVGQLYEPEDLNPGDIPLETSRGLTQSEMKPLADRFVDGGEMIMAAMPGPSGPGSTPGFALAKPTSGAKSPVITPLELIGKSADEIRELAKSKGLVPHPTRMDKWLDPVTGKERLRIDPGHIDKHTGLPYNDPKAAVPHHHGYLPDGRVKIIDPIDGNPHFPTAPTSTQTTPPPLQ